MTYSNNPAKVLERIRDQVSYPVPEWDKVAEYGQILANGYDTIVETFDLKLTNSFLSRAEWAKEEALKAWEETGKREKGRAIIDLAGVRFQIDSHAARGLVFYIHNEDFEIKVRSPEMGWCVTVRYSSAGLWKDGIGVLRETIMDVLADMGQVLSTDWERVSEIHYCVDIYSPKFSAEINFGMADQMIAVKGVKTDVIGAGGKPETITTGLSTSRIQNQLYDKSREIREKSGKAWMREVYAQNGFEWPEHMDLCDIWRIEVRIKKDFMHERGVKTLDQAFEKIAQLTTEALMTRRLADLPEKNDSNRRRWPLHRLWAGALVGMGLGVPSERIGKQPTMTLAEFKTMMKQQIEGVLTSVMAAESAGAYPDAITVDELTAQIRDSLEDRLEDDDWQKKFKAKVEKHRFIEEMH